MSQDVRQLEPQPLWNHFADLNAVPRPSKKEDRVIQFAKEFGESLGLETIVDSVGNVIIRKPASAGMEDRQTVVMQSHLDMVCQKNADTEFDFDSQGIQMFVDGDWVRAKGTTLGADNGIGVASIMALLASDDIPHPSLEALFTIDEETGMTGAKGLQGGLLTGSIMLNLDTEDDDELTIGCAGGVDVTARRSYDGEPIPVGWAAMRISVRGLKGGHSGMDIFLGRGNANKIMNRLLWRGAREAGLRVAQIEGGGLRNAIPRESAAVVVVPEDKVAALNALIESESQAIRAEYATTDPELEIECQDSDTPDHVIPAALQTKLLGVVYACPCGIHRMCPDVKDLVQTSNNLASVTVKDGKLKICCLTRSSVNSERDDLANAIMAGFELLDAEATASGDYPGWQPVPSASIVKLMADLYEEMFAEPAHVAACHAGLECGIVGTNYPEMEMISFGPNIRGAHSPDECVQVSSVQKYWGFLLETLQRIPLTNS
jgi:dipeptidase D